MAAGEQLKETSQLPADRDNLQEKLDNMSQRWTDLNDSSDDRTAKLEQAVKLTNEYQEQRGHFVPWLNGAEERADAIRLTCDPKALESCKQHVEVILQIGLDMCFDEFSFHFQFPWPFCPHLWKWQMPKGVFPRLQFYFVI